MQRLEAALHRACAKRRPGPHRPDDTLEVLCPEVLKLEQVAHELSRTFGNDHAVRFCNALQACRKVRRLANDCLLLRSARSDQVADNNEAGCDADTGLQRSTWVFSAPTAATNSSPARTARSASSSWACG